MSLRAVLVRPSNKTGSAYLQKWGFLPAPLGLLALAGELLKIDQSKVKIIDMEGDGMTIDQTVDQSLDFHPDLVGVTLHATAAHNNAGYIARAVKERRPDTILVAGGHHATFLPVEVLNSGFDISVLGEGDETIYELGKAVSENGRFDEIRGIVFRDGNRIVRTPPRSLIRDLDTLPLPAMDLVDGSKYTFKVFGDDSSVMCIETSRGCPYACDFCSVTPTWGNRWRNKSNGRILEEMDLAKRLGYDWIFFTDDIFVVYPNVKHREELFRSINAKGLDTKWIVQMRADVTSRNPDLIRLAAKAGMSISFLGVESGSEEILKKMHKGEFTPQSVDAVKVLSENGIVVLIGMMIGAPYERFSDILASLKFSRELSRGGADAIQFSIYTPLPGTRVFDDAIRGEKLFTLDWDRYDVLTPVMKTRTNPVIDQIAQFYGNYSFYIYKYIRNRFKGIDQANNEKLLLLNNSMKFILKTIPDHIRSIASFPRFLMETWSLYTNGKEFRDVDLRKVSEAMETSNKIVYDLSDTKNPYFMIKQVH